MVLSIGQAPKCCFIKCFLIGMQCFLHKYAVTKPQKVFYRAPLDSNSKNVVTLFLSCL